MSDPRAGVQPRHRRRLQLSFHLTQQIVDDECVPVTDCVLWTRIRADLTYGPMMVAA